MLTTQQLGKTCDAGGARVRRLVWHWALVVTLALSWAVVGLANDYIVRLEDWRGAFAREVMSVLHGRETQWIFVAVTTAYLGALTLVRIRVRRDARPVEAAWQLSTVAVIVAGYFLRYTEAAMTQRLWMLVVKRAVRTTRGFHEIDVTTPLVRSRGRTDGGASRRHRDHNHDSRMAARAAAVRD